MRGLNLNKPSHIMVAWAALTATGAGFYIITKNGIYVRRREQAIPSSTIPAKTNELSCIVLHKKTTTHISLMLALFFVA
ncbi:unnamed protein product [Mortierella alpina]